MNIKSLILARGGSKGIPKKNIMDINGKPLISYTINSCLKSQANNVWVSTDSHEIRDIAEIYGANTILRPEQISGDKNKSEEALLHFAENIDFDILVFVQPTSPLLLEQDIDDGLNIMKIHNYDSVFSAYKEHWIPRWNLNITPDNWDPKNRPMRQDMSEKYVENGAFYIMKKEHILSGQRYGNKIGVVEMPLCRSFQIDTYDDLDLIKKLL
jgi:CMP-N,N'-diacetyllegionaminic acid synthase